MISASLKGEYHPKVKNRYDSLYAFTFDHLLRYWVTDIIEHGHCKCYLTNSVLYLVAHAYIVLFLHWIYTYATFWRMVIEQCSCQEIFFIKLLIFPILELSNGSYGQKIASLTTVLFGKPLYFFDGYFFFLSYSQVGHTSSAFMTQGGCHRGA